MNELLCRVGEREVARETEAEAEAEAEPAVERAFSVRRLREGEEGEELELLRTGEVEDTRLCCCCNAAYCSAREGAAGVGKLEFRRAADDGATGIR